MRAWSWVVCVVMSACCFQNITGDSEDIKLPSYVEVCYRDDPKVAECMKRNMEKLMPKFKKGSSDFDLEPLDPMVFRSMSFTSKSPIIGGEVVSKNLQLIGLTQAKVTSVRPKLNIPHQFIVDFDLHVPQLVVKSDYDFIGNLLNIPLTAKGRVDLLLDKVNISYHISGKTKTIKDYDYLELDELSWNFHGSGIKELTLRNDDVIDGIPALNSVVKNVMNSSWRLLIDEVLPNLLPESSKNLKEKFAKAFKKYPYDIILPKRTQG